MSVPGENWPCLRGSHPVSQALGGLDMQSVALAEFPRKSFKADVILVSFGCRKKRCTARSPAESNKLCHVHLRECFRPTTPAAVGNSGSVGGLLLPNPLPTDRTDAPLWVFLSPQQRASQNRVFHDYLMILDGGCPSKPTSFGPP